MCFQSSPWVLPNPKDYPALLERPEVNGGTFSSVVCEVDIGSGVRAWTCMDHLCLIVVFCLGASEYFNSSPLLDSSEETLAQAARLTEKISNYTLQLLEELEFLKGKPSSLLPFTPKASSKSPDKLKMEVTITPLR
jgi:hypothetical protein